VVIIAGPNPGRCDGHHPVTVMERQTRSVRETAVFGANL